MEYLVIVGYFAVLLGEKEKNPGDDLLSAFNAAKDENGEPLSMMDKLAWCQIIMVAGNETTRNATSGGMLALIEHQDQLRKIQNDEGLLKPAIEEILRWTSPVIHFSRTATRDCELGDRQILEGEKVTIWYPSANRDESVFDDPFRFDVRRSPNPHVAFGAGGPHFCLGANLARMEMRVAFEELLRRLPDMEYSRGGPVFQGSSLVRSCAEMWVKYTPES